MIIRVDIQFVVQVNDDRDLDLSNPLRWNLMYSDPETETILFDTDFNEWQEGTYVPTIQITKLLDPYDPQ